MKLYSDTLTTADLYACLPSDVDIASLRTMKRPRKRANGWEVSLEGFGARHTRRSNSGDYGAGYTMAATWDDHGVWMAALYDRDPDAIFAGYYDNRDDFYAKTRHDFHWRQRSRFTSVRDNAQAPWLHEEAIRREHADNLKRLNFWREREGVSA